MIELLIGLLLFLGTHSLRIVAEDWRVGLISTLGDKKFKGLVSVASLIGFILIIHGYGVARLTPQILWVPPVATRHVAALLMLFAMIFLVASYIPGNHIKARLRHPMVISVKVWSVAHLLANGMAADVLLFGSFLLWAVFDFRAARQRDRMGAIQTSTTIDTAAGSSSVPASNVALKPATVRGTVMAIVLGTALWVGFVAYLHLKLFGVSPLGL
ncbi:MAG: protein NrnU [Betaproteobacteria bacterium]|nr:protein NrnU [Betaproteobacteria bacterium]